MSLEATSNYYTQIFWFVQPKHHKNSKSIGIIGICNKNPGVSQIGHEHTADASWMPSERTTMVPSQTRGQYTQTCHGHLAETAMHRQYTGTGHPPNLWKGTKSMSTGILLFHPNYAASKVNRRLIDELKSRHLSNVTVRDEYALYPDFKVDKAAEQAFVESVDHLVLEFPFYWYSAPGLLQQWKDTVLTPGWAYAGGTALDGKTLQLVVTTGSPASRYQTDGEYKHTMKELLSPFELTAFRVDLTWREPILVQNTSAITEEELDAAAKAYADAFTD
ncbi:hypothetical protein CS006_03950 [Bifidobacterium primatium]|uniref:Flavodoxin-like fold domain-containing protein n=2 Tax=Bifidobacterium primatium TaxID=2045438 RepID=A0A2M9H8R7_9BIFI|nr:hypothetical protein CS006_03950 [Bifidobacterium primatium]